MTAAELKKSLTTEDIINIVVKGLGSREEMYGGKGEIIFSTVCHNPAGEGKHKLYYYPDGQSFHCYTHCSDSFDIFELVQRAGKADTFRSAFLYIANFLGVNPYEAGQSEADFELTDDWDLLNKYDDYSLGDGEHKPELTRISPNMLEYFAPLVPHIWYKEGISVEAMEKYGIRMDSGMEKIIIPHYDIDGNLVGIRGRSCNVFEVADGKKYMPVYIENDCYRHPLGENLYGLNFNQEAIRKARKAVIFEGEKSVLKAETYYGENNFTVAACGSSISDTQIDLLLSLGVNEIIIAFDKENDDLMDSEMTTEYKEKLRKITARFSPYVNTYYVFDYFKKLDYKDSPIDKGKDTLEFLLKQKILVPSFSAVANGKGRR